MRGVTNPDTPTLSLCPRRGRGERLDRRLQARQLVRRQLFSAVGVAIERAHYVRAHGAQRLVGGGQALQVLERPAVGRPWAAGGSPELLEAAKAGEHLRGRQLSPHVRGAWRAL